MVDTSKAKIFLASERGHSETDSFRHYNTFNCGSHQSEHKTPFGALYGWNDFTLGAEKGFHFFSEEDSFLFLLPVVGAIEYRDEEGNDCILQAGESLLCPVLKGKAIEVNNPYENELVNFLQGWIRKDNALASSHIITPFLLDDNKNNLIEIIHAQPGVKCLLGKFDGRSEGELKTTHDDSRVFVFVVQGAFEVQNRLLEAKDGLALWNTGTIEFEALSNEAILLFVEMMPF